jgi:hypothetical protein
LIFSIISIFISITNSPTFRNWSNSRMHNNHTSMNFICRSYNKIFIIININYFFFFNII